MSDSVSQYESGLYVRSTSGALGRFVNPSTKKQSKKGSIYEIFCMKIICVLQNGNENLIIRPSQSFFTVTSDFAPGRLMPLKFFHASMGLRLHICLKYLLVGEVIGYAPLGFTIFMFLIKN